MDLTNPDYWNSRQRGDFKATRDEILCSIPEWLHSVRPWLEGFRGGRMLELGCSPGLVSAQLFAEFGFDATGVDFSPSADAYLHNMKLIGCPKAELHRVDFREYSPAQLFDVVVSVGLIEHFEDPGTIFLHHVRVLRPGGLLVIVVPNFRYLQYAYHRLFDAPDLARHNTDVMNRAFFESCSERFALRTEFVGYAGRLRFWNLDLGGPRWRLLARRIFSRVARDVGRSFGLVLPPGLKYSAPWLAFVATKL